MVRKVNFNFQVNFSERWLYTFVALGIMVLLGVGVYAFGTSNPSAFGHSDGEIQSLSWSKITGVPADLADGDDVGLLGSGTTDYLSKWTGAGSLGDSIIFETATGNIGIGTTNPTSKLDVNGQIRISGGSPGSGKILTSNANGLASWQNTISYAGGGTRNCIIYPGTYSCTSFGMASCDVFNNFKCNTGLYIITALDGSQCCSKGSCVPSYKYLCLEVPGY